MTPELIEFLDLYISRQKSKFFHLRVFQTLLCIALVGCTAQRDPGYIVTIPAITNDQLFPEALSGDGRVLVGNSGTIGPWKWTKEAGIKSIDGLPSGYSATAEAVDFDGSVIVGQILKSDGSRALYWLSGDAWPQQLPQLPQNEQAYPPFDVSNDGTSISFLRYENKITTMACGISNSSLKSLRALQVIWSETSGYKDASPLIRNQCEYVRMMRDFKNYLLGTSEPFNFGRLESNGKYVPFQEPQNGVDPISDTLITNVSGTWVLDQQSAYPQQLVIWNPDGRISVRNETLPGCKSFDPVAVDEDGNMFGNIWCSYSPDGPVGVRVSASAVETISDWLTSQGLSNKLGLSTHVRFISQDGRTILGDTGFSPIVSGGSSILSATQNPSKESGVFFVAHLP